MFDEVKRWLQLLALEGVAYAQVNAKKLLLETGTWLAGEERRKEAAKFVRSRWAGLTMSIPVLNATELDDDWIEKHSYEAVDAAFDKIGEVVKGLSDSIPTPNVQAPDLEPGGLEK